MYKRGFPFAPLLIGLLMTITACSVFDSGAGDVVTEERQVSEFERISLRGAGSVTVAQGGTESLSIEANDNIMDRVSAEVINGTLELGLEDGVTIGSNSQLIFIVGVDDLNGLSVDGSGRIESENIDTSSLEATVSGSGGIRIVDLGADDVRASVNGSGDINLAGEATAQIISISGPGSYFASDLCSESVTVSIDGPGGVTVCATETLETTINGSGSVNYYGLPSINSSGDGSGQVTGLGEK